MGIRERFRKLVGKPEPVSDRENLRRGTVRTGNLDWQGLPIDRHAGAPIAPPPELRGYRQLVADFLDGLTGGIKIERPNPHIPVMGLNQFDRDSAATEAFHLDRMGNGHRVKIANNRDDLQ